MDLLRRLGIGTERERGGRGRDGSAGETAATDYSSPPEQTETEGSTMETEEMSTLHDIRESMNEDPAIARRAKFWSDKYAEDRTKTVEVRVRTVEERLLTEFPQLGRKGARYMAQKVTRDWA